MLPEVEIPWFGVVRSHALLVALAAVVSATLGIWSTHRSEDLPLGRVVLAVVLLAICVFAGGRAHFVFTKWHLFSEDPGRMLRWSSGGLHAPGAVLAGLIGGWATLRLLGLAILRFADRFAPAVGVGIGIARLGCFLNGCCFGDLCDLPWGVRFPAGTAAHLEQVEAGVVAHGSGYTRPVHPLPLYFAAAGFGIAAVLAWLQRRKAYDGQIVLWLVFLFASSSAVLEPLRAHHSLRVYWAGQPQLLWVTIGMSLASGLALLAGRSRMASRRDQSPQPHSEPD